ncbi:MAG: calcium-binding protein, partial [Sulfuricurvum sp.]
MGINFQYTSTLNLTALDTKVNDMYIFGITANTLTAVGALTTYTSTEMIYVNGQYSLDIIGTNFIPSSLPSTYSITKMVYKNNTTNQTITIDGLITYAIDALGNQTLVDSYGTKMTYTAPYDGKTFTFTESAKKLPIDEAATSDILNYSYVIDDGNGGIVSFQIPSITSSTYNLIGSFATIKQTFEFFNTSTFLSSDDVISIKGSRELFRDTNGNPLLNGYAGNDTLTGSSANDTIIGGVGADTMSGGAGNDTYYVDNVGDKVIELANQGTDIIRTSVSYTLGANIENLTLTGTSNINGTGNSLNNTLTGNNGANILNGGAGVDILNGGAGADTLFGGAGNDTYYVDNVGDKVYETTTAVSGIDSGGIDLVNTTISYTLGANIENLTLTGTSNINGTGNSLNNALTGNSGANILNGGAGADTLFGGAGNDTLTGGAGRDSFVFNTALNGATNKDTITDFTATDDIIKLENGIFTKLATVGTLATGNFYASATGVAHDANDYILYNTASGVLSYDADGNGAGSAIAFATL